MMTRDMGGECLQETFVLVDTEHDRHIVERLNDEKARQLKSQREAAIAVADGKADEKDMPGKVSATLRVDSPVGAPSKTTVYLSRNGGTIYVDGKYLADVESIEIEQERGKAPMIRVELRDFDASETEKPPTLSSFLLI